MNKLFPVINQDKCAGCGDCASECPEGIIGISDEKGVVSILKHEKENRDCIYCGICETVCHKGAIRCPFIIIVR